MGHCMEARCSRRSPRRRIFAMFFLGVVDGVIDLLKSAASLLSVATKLAQAIKALIKLFV